LTLHVSGFSNSTFAKGHYEAPVFRHSG